MNQKLGNFSTILGILLLTCFLFCSCWFWCLHLCICNWWQFLRVFFSSLFHLLETFLSIILNSNRVRGAKEVSPFPTRVSLCVMYIALLVNVSILLCTNLHLCLKTKVYLNKFTKLYTLNDRAGHEFEAELKSKILSLIFFCLFLFCLCVVCVGFRFEKASIWLLFRSLVCCWFVLFCFVQMIFLLLLHKNVQFCSRVNFRFM